MAQGVVTLHSNNISQAYPVSLDPLCRGLLHIIKLYTVCIPDCGSNLDLTGAVYPRTLQSPWFSLPSVYTTVFIVSDSCCSLPCIGWSTIACRVSSGTVHALCSSLLHRQSWLVAICRSGICSKIWMNGRGLDTVLRSKRIDLSLFVYVCTVSIDSLITAQVWGMALHFAYQACIWKGMIKKSRVVHLILKLRNSIN